MLAEMNKTEFTDELMNALDCISQTLIKLSDEDFHAPRKEGKWSPSQIIGHLILSTKAVQKSFSFPKEVLQSKFGSIERDEWSYQYLKDFYLNRLSEGVTAPPPFISSDDSSIDISTHLENLKIAFEDLIQEFNKWHEEDLSNTAVPHPALGLLTLREMLVFTHLHTSHHLAQIEEVISPEG